MPRRVRLTWPKDSRSAGAVTSRVFDPGTGWTLAEAREMLQQGYSSMQVAKITGYPERMISIGSSGAAAS